MMFRKYIECGNTVIELLANNEVAGRCWISNGTIFGVFIAPMYRRQGWGTELVKEAIAAGGRELHVAPFGNPDMTKEQTRQWYRSLGFHKDSNYEWRMHR
jgi:ribosomal protein S18 acetylase RimI-like enzyme